MSRDRDVDGAMSREILSHRVPVVCDFCSGQPVEWSYPARNFELAEIEGVGHHSLGSWTACEECAGYIEDDNYELLLVRVVRRLRVDSPHLRLALYTLYRQFKAHRTGPREPYAHHPDDGFTIREQVE